MKTCLTEEILAQVAEGKCLPKELARVYRHVQDCSDCAALLSALSFMADLDGVGLLEPVRHMTRVMRTLQPKMKKSVVPVDKTFKMRLSWRHYTLSEWRMAAAVFLREPSVAFMGINLTEENMDCLYPSVTMHLHENELTFHFAEPYPAKVDFNWGGKTQSLVVPSEGVMKIRLPKNLLSDMPAAMMTVVPGMGSNISDEELEIPITLSKKS